MVVDLRTGQLSPHLLLPNHLRHDYGRLVFPQRDLSSDCGGLSQTEEARWYHQFADTLDSVFKQLGFYRKVLTLNEATSAKEEGGCGDDAMEETHGLQLEPYAAPRPALQPFPSTNVGQMEGSLTESDSAATHSHRYASYEERSTARRRFARYEPIRSNLPLRSILGASSRPSLPPPNSSVPPVGEVGEAGMLMTESIMSSVTLGPPGEIPCVLRHPTAREYVCPVAGCGAGFEYKTAAFAHLRLHDAHTRLASPHLPVDRIVRPFLPPDAPWSLGRPGARKPRSLSCLDHSLVSS
jgi:hypothetical protein